MYSYCFIINNNQTLQLQMQLIMFCFYNILLIKRLKLQQVVAEKWKQQYKA